MRITKKSVYFSAFINTRDLLLMWLFCNDDEQISRFAIEIFAIENTLNTGCYRGSQMTEQVGFFEALWYYHTIDYYIIFVVNELLFFLI